MRAAQICSVPDKCGQCDARVSLSQRGPDWQCEPAHKFHRRHPALAFKLNLKQQ